MNFAKILVFGLVVMFLVNAGLDDVFGSFRESKNSIHVTQVNEYSNYIHFQPEWKSYPRNLIVDISTTWDRQIIPGQEQEPDISKYGAKQRQNTLQYINSKPVVAVQYDYRDCQSQWFHYAKTGLDFIGNQFGLYLESEKSIVNTAYSDKLQKQKLQDGFAQFVPICTSKESTSYDYTISVNDDTIGFDVYFVPSEIQQWNYFLYPENFEYYADDDCYGNNFQKFSGTCSNVEKNSGLLIIIPDELSRPMTKISVELTEK